MAMRFCSITTCYRSVHKDDLCERHYLDRLSGTASLEGTLTGQLCYTRGCLKFAAPGERLCKDHTPKPKKKSRPKRRASEAVTQLPVTYDAEPVDPLDTLCIVEGCSNDVFHNQMCMMHYYRVYDNA